MSRHYFGGRRISTMLGIFALSMCSAGSAFGQYSFVQQNGPIVADWASNANWLDSGSPATSYPNGANVTALLDAPLTTIAQPVGGFTINLPSNGDSITVGSLVFDFTGHTYSYNNTIQSQGGKIIFQSTSGPAIYTETAGIDPDPGSTANQARTRIITPVDILSDLILTQDNRIDLNTSSIWTQPVSAPTTVTLTKEGDANIEFQWAGALGASEGFQGKYVINNGGIRILGNAAIQKSTGVTVNSGGQLQIAAGVLTPSLAAGATLTLSGEGKSNATSNAPQGALRFQLNNGQSSTFSSPVVFENDATISAAAANTTGIISGQITGAGGLTKHGNGTLILSNTTNSYGGDTHLLSAPVSPNISTLSLAAAFLPDGRDVYLPSTLAALNLNYSGEDTIRSLFVDDVAKPIGKYGAVDDPINGITGLPGIITGTGILNVTEVPGLAGDHNGDGVVDAADYVLWRKDPDTYGGTPGGYDAWVADFGESEAGSGGGAPAPEPTTCVSLVIVAAVALVKRRRC
jgi:autotransporter-associated beta strand protein